MTLAEVLAQKGKAVVTLWTNHTLKDAVRIFDERSVSSVVIVDPERRPLGLLTDRDAVHAIARHGPSALAMGVTHVMISPVPSCAPETTVGEAMRRMTVDRVRHLVIMSDDQMSGIVSIGDLVKVRLDEAATEGRVLRDLALSRMAAE
jgi:signal-transduction protein with cAMP-binding, CBS, and nucleotidyltransferase domain